MLKRHLAISALSGLALCCWMPVSFHGEQHSVLLIRTGMKVGLAHTTCNNKHF
jgi:hypothetical protein